MLQKLDWLGNWMANLSIFWQIFICMGFVAVCVQLIMTPIAYYTLGKDKLDGGLNPILTSLVVLIFTLGIAFFTACFTKLLFTPRKRSS
jgi:membrane-anchored glycerophosphoryl diester phosphodiesterase (GDPDase)